MNAAVAGHQDVAAGAPLHRSSGTRRSGWYARHQIGIYLVLAFGLSWWSWPFVRVSPTSTPMVSFGPIIAAVAATALVGRRRGLLLLLRAAVQWRVPWSQYVIALAGPFVLAGVAVAAAVGFGVVDASQLRDNLGWSTWRAMPVLLLTTALLGGPMFEEVGWRGFLLEKLQRRRGALFSTALVGVIWVSWHLPLLVSDPSGQRPIGPFLVWTLADCVLLTWIYNISSGSILMAILFHTAANVTGRLLLEPVLGAGSFLTLWWLMAAGYALAAVVVITRTRGHLGTPTSHSLASTDHAST